MHVLYTPILAPNTNSWRSLEFFFCATRNILSIVITCFCPYLLCIFRVPGECTNKQHAMRYVVPAKCLDEETNSQLNLSGPFDMRRSHILGRRAIIDVYGGCEAHSGGDFSGKDIIKIVGSALCTARWVAKSLIAAGHCHRVLVQLSYTIGLALPLSVFDYSYDADSRLIEIVNTNFDQRLRGMIRELEPSQTRLQG